MHPSSSTIPTRLILSHLMPKGPRHHRMQENYSLAAERKEMRFYFHSDIFCAVPSSREIGIEMHETGLLGKTCVSLGLKESCQAAAVIVWRGSLRRLSMGMLPWNIFTVQRNNFYGTEFFGDESIFQTKPQQTPQCTQHGLLYPYL